MIALATEIFAALRKFMGIERFSENMPRSRATANRWLH